MAPTQLRPDFLICSERSGSNLIRSILHAHPDVYAPEPIHLTAFWDRLNEFGDLADDTNWRTLLTAIAEFYAGWMGELDPSLVVTADELSRRIESREFVSVYEHFYGTALAASGKTRLFLKENHAAQRADILLRHYPDARFLWQVRDPRDYLASCKKMRGYKYGSASDSIRVWQDDQAAAIRLYGALGPQQVHVISYETLIADAERVMRGVCEFMDLPFAPEMLEFHKTEEAQKAATRGPWRNVGKAIMTDNKGRFAKTLSGLEIGLLEATVGDLMGRFGYERVQSVPGGLRRCVLANYASLERRIRRWRHGNELAGRSGVDRTIDEHGSATQPIHVH